MKPIRRGRFPLLILAVVLAWSPSPVWSQSQTTSAVRGVATRVDGTPIAEAMVQIRNDRTGTERSVLTDSEGRFLLALLQPGGPYTLTISHLGFADGLREGIELQVGETHLVEMVLLERAVEVEGVSVAVERRELFTRRQQGPVTLLDERSLTAIPLASRDVMDLTVLSPLVRTTEAGGFVIAYWSPMA